MKFAVILILAAAGALLFPLATADATTPELLEERRSSMLATFLLISLMMGGFCMLCAYHLSTSLPSDPTLELSSVVVPPIKQESNIVLGIIRS